MSKELTPSSYLEIWGKKKFFLSFLKLIEAYCIKYEQSSILTGKKKEGCIPAESTHHLGKKLMFRDKILRGIKSSYLPN